MNAQQIQQFMDAMAASDLAEMEVSHEGWTLRLFRHGRPAASPAEARAVPVSASAGALAAPPSGGTVYELVAPLHGVVHFQSAPGEPPFAQPGDEVQAGQLLCIVEAMKVFNEVHAEQGGCLARWLVASGTEVEAGQGILVIEPLAHV